MCTVLSFVSSLNRRRVVACSSSLFTSACISSSVAYKGTPFIMHDSLFSSCGFIVSLAVEPSKAFDFHALTMRLALSSVVNCMVILGLLVWYLYGTIFSMMIGPCMSFMTFRSWSRLNGLALVNCFVRLTMIHREGLKLADWWFFGEMLLGFGMCGWGVAVCFPLSSMAYQLWLFNLLMLAWYTMLSIMRL